MLNILYPADLRKKMIIFVPIKRMLYYFRKN